MNPNEQPTSSDPTQAKAGPPVYEVEIGVWYSLEMIAELAGVEESTVMRYRECGFLRPVPGAAEAGERFDEECLRQLRRIEHLRRECALNETGLRMILELLEEVEFLRQERRQGTR